MWIVQHNDFSRSPKDERILWLTTMFGHSKRGFGYPLDEPNNWVEDFTKGKTLRIEFESEEEIENLIAHLRHMLREERLANEKELEKIEQKKNEEVEFKY